MRPRRLHPGLRTRPSADSDEVRVTRRLGDSIHAYAVMAALAAEGRAHAFVAYRPFAALFAGGPLVVLPSDHGTQWRARPGAFRGPRHGEHVRDTMGKAAGVIDHGLLHVGLVVPPRRPPGASYAVVCPNAGAVYKEWPHDRWSAVVEYLLSRGHEVFVCGMPGNSPIPTPAAATQLDCGIAELASLIAGARMLIGPDSGPLHLADALNIPVVGLYGATSSLTYGPYRNRSLCVDTHGECIPPSVCCNSAKHHPDGGMGTISVERVLAAVSQVSL